MLDPNTLPRVREVIQGRAQADRGLLDRLRAEIRPLAGDVRRIYPRSATAIALVGSDGGNNKLQFDPFLIQLVRIVDSYGKEFFLDAVSPRTDTVAHSANQFGPKSNPTVTKRQGHVPVGTIIFDVDGEYCWPDDKGRPGLCDVPELKDKVVVFTEKKGPSGFYDSFVSGDIRLDIRRLRPVDVISIALTNEQQNQQNVRKLRGLSPERWEELVNLIDSQGPDADPDQIKEILRLGEEADAEAAAAKSNMNYIVRLLHSRSSQLLDMLMEAILEYIPDTVEKRDELAFKLVPMAMDHIFGSGGWKTERRPKKNDPSKDTAWVVKGQ